MAWINAGTLHKLAETIFCATMKVISMTNLIFSKPVISFSVCIPFLQILSTAATPSLVNYPYRQPNHVGCHTRWINILTNWPENICNYLSSLPDFVHLSHRSVGEYDLSFGFSKVLITMPKKEA